MTSMSSRRNMNIQPPRAPLIGGNVGIAAFLLVGLPCILWFTGLALPPSASVSDEPAALPSTIDFAAIQAGVPGGLEARMPL